MTSDLYSEWTATWHSEVTLNRASYSGAVAVRYTHEGPVEFKLDAKDNLRLVLTSKDGGEIDIALHLAGTFTAAAQEMETPPEPEPVDDEPIQVVNGNGDEETPW